jgi:rfaE bifunctional protein nucleotidyltransferase chain/domain
VSNDVFGPGSNFQKRFVRDYDELVKRVDACRQIGLKIVLTSGAFDIKHVGHDRYLEQGKMLAEGGVLVVGVDSDEKVRAKKGPNRPVVSEEERLEAVCHLRHVDLVTLKPHDSPRWELIRRVRPDVLLITEETYDTPESLKELQEFLAAWGGMFHRIPPQAQTSTTAKIRRLMFDLKEKVKQRLCVAKQTIDGQLEEINTWIDEI